VGDFDGNTFKCDDAPDVAKFLDYGKDHYATVTFSNTGSRVIALPWMSNWQYGNVTPIKQYRGANGLPRDLQLFEQNGNIYMSANVSPEVLKLRQSEKVIGDLKPANEQKVDKLFDKNDGAFELTADITPMVQD
jgi:fructan beta-fructosidase